MSTVLSPPEQSLVLEDVSWVTYQRLLSEHPDSAGTRFAYDRGRLEIMVLSAKHEKYKDVLALLVNVVAEEMEINISSFGSTTFRREDLQRGFEPDACFYIQSEEQVSGKDELDLSVDPPPDLVIEIDISRPSLNKFPIYAAGGVNEVWRYDGEQVRIFTLAGNRYVEQPASSALPTVTSQALSAWVEASQQLKRTVWLRQVRAWARAQTSGDPA